MPHPILVFVDFLRIPIPMFHFGTVTSLLYLSSCLRYLSGNIRLTNAYSGRNRPLLRFRGTQHLLSR
jgi:hypothetical protein